MWPLLCLAVVVLTSEVVEGSCVSERTLSVMTFNVWNWDDGPPWQERRARIGRLVREANPDVVGMQEVRRNLGPPASSMMQDIKGHLPVEYGEYWAFRRAGIVGQGREEGVGLFSRVALSNLSGLDLSTSLGCPDRVDRTVLSVFLPGFDVRVFVTHWSWSKCQQVYNARETASFMTGSSSTSSILVGDFNAFEERAEALLILQEAQSPLVDSWRALHPFDDSKPNDTFGMTFSPLPDKGGLHNRCDRVYHSGNIRPRSAKVLCDANASDHCAVLVSFLVNLSVDCAASLSSSSSSSSSSPRVSRELPWRPLIVCEVLCVVSVVAIALRSRRVP